MVADRVLVDSAVQQRVGTFYHVAGLVQVLPLPLDEFAVGRVDRDEARAGTMKAAEVVARWLSAAKCLTIVAAVEFCEQVLRNLVEVAVQVDCFGGVVSRSS